MKVNGIGGVFFKVKDPETTRNWYKENLGLNTDQYGTNFEWRQADEGTDKGFTQWSPFEADSDDFDGAFMLNYRVTDMTGLLKELESKDVEIIGEVQEHEYGKFVHIRDHDGHMVELWEPVDDVYDAMVGEGRTK
jgi:catechol 2,3-dioxygenase-like lactoylglutathione lyase family enzyme